MSSPLDPSLGGWDRTFLDLSSKIAEPFCAVWNLLCFRLVAPLDPQKFENCTTQTQEVATRVLIGLGALLGGFLTYAMPVSILCSAVVLGGGSKLLRAIGFALQKGGYTRIRGTASEKAFDRINRQLKVMSWNVCGIGGGLSLDHGGVIHWRSRCAAIVEKIKIEDPDLLILQEIYDTAFAEALIEKLQSRYAHFFIHLGPNVWGSVGGGMILSKCAVHHFSHTSFTNNHWTLNRGFATLELKANSQDALPCIRIVGTHLIHGNEPEDTNKRMAQITQMIDYLAGQALSIPTILAGDLNIERNKEARALLSPSLRHSYTGTKPTCTNRLVAQWDSRLRDIWDETIDYISLFKNTSPFDAKIVFKDCHLVEAFDQSYNTKTALSDHHGLAVVIRGI